MKQIKIFYELLGKLFILFGIIGLPFLVNGIIDGPWGFAIYAFTFPFIKKLIKTKFFENL